MTALSIQLPIELARTSMQVAKRLGVSRSAFIRSAIQHEIQFVRARAEQESMLKAFKAMIRDSAYLKEATEIMDKMGNTLPEDLEQWWKQP